MVTGPHDRAGGSPRRSKTAPVVGFTVVVLGPLCMGSVPGQGTKIPHTMWPKKIPPKTHKDLAPAIRARRTTGSWARMPVCDLGPVSPSVVWAEIGVRLGTQASSALEVCSPVPATCCRGELWPL